MLSLIIADDEQIIRDSISSIVDWASLDIELIGVCKDGFEAYNMIIDENPDIAITDIMMPGLNGLQLVERSRAMNAATEFIILSGYQEFDFAKQALKYEVRDYLLKPCNENEIINVLKKVKELILLKKSYTTMNLENETLRNKMVSLAVKQAIIECFTTQELTDTINTFDYMNRSASYCQISIHYLEKNYVSTFIKQAAILLDPYPQKFIYYVMNTLIIILPYCENNHYDSLCKNLCNITYPGQVVALDYIKQVFTSLKNLISILVPRIKRFGKVYVVDEFGSTEEICNYALVFSDVEQLLVTAASDSAAFKVKLAHSLNEFEDPELARIYSFRLFRSLQEHITKNPTMVVFSFSSYLQSLIKLESIKEIIQFTSDTIITISRNYTTHDNSYRSFIQKTIEIAQERLSDPNLSLKQIAEEYLYMNVDYVSREFYKATNEKFSTFLTRIRMEKAKTLLSQATQEKIYTISEQVGCCNSQYFSQVFKKYTGMSPSDYITQYIV